MLKNLKIENFRGIRNLELKDFSDVNILIGQNGVGKTTILEALALVSNPTNPAIATKIGNWREQVLSPNNDSLISTFFHDRNINSNQNFEFDDGNGKQNLTISKLTDLAGIPVPVDFSDASPGAVAKTEHLRGLEFILQQTKDKRHRIRLIIQPNGAHVHMDPPYYTGSLGCFFISSRTSTSIGETANLLTQLSSRHEGDKLLKVIQVIDDRVKNIETGVAGPLPTILVDIGANTKLPVNVMGDGFCRITLMATGALYSEGKLLIVDEIDSGIHVSIMTRFWGIIAKTAKENGKQIFSATHSEDMLSHTIESFSGSPEALRIFRIDRRRDGSSVATKFTYDEYLGAENHGLDIR